MIGSPGKGSVSAIRLIDDLRKHKWHVMCFDMMLFSVRSAEPAAATTQTASRLLLSCHTACQSQARVQNNTLKETEWRALGFPHHAFVRLENRNAV